MAKKDSEVAEPRPALKNVKKFICKPPRPRLCVVRWQKICKNC